jgi:2-haloacid dehalogenase
MTVGPVARTDRRSGHDTAERKPQAVLFDLLTALLDSWSLWERAGGSAGVGHRWRAAASRLMVGSSGYRDYRELVEEARLQQRVAAGATRRLLESWDTIAPWPEVAAFLGAMRLPYAVVTNCSDALATAAAERLPRRPAAIISAERAGAYKPDPRPYALALEALSLAPGDALYVGGSPYDVRGALAFGLPTVWIDRGLVRDTWRSRLPSCPRLESLMELGELLPLSAPGR